MSPVVTSDDVNRALKACDIEYKEIDIKLAGIIANKISDMTDSRNEAAMFLAQLIHESGGFQCLEEDPDSRRGRDYGEYYGRGFIQLTGKDNYEAAAKSLYHDQHYFQSASNRQKIVDDPRVAMDVSVWFWKNEVRRKRGPELNNFGLTTDAINGFLEEDWKGEVPKKRYRYYKSIANEFGIKDLASDKFYHKYQ
uniref:Putative glycoside hydrolase family 19 chitinase domain protein n=1 Tax=Culex tarsalis TaxID=7177 RepID=A0A1Q3G559_CULTA